MVLSIAQREGVQDQIKGIDPTKSEWLKAELIKLMATDGGAQIDPGEGAGQWMPKLMKLVNSVAPEPQATFDDNGMLIQAAPPGPAVRKTTDAPSQGGFKKQQGVQ